MKEPSKKTLRWAEEEIKSIDRNPPLFSLKEIVWIEAIQSFGVVAGYSWLEDSTGFCAWDYWVTLEKPCSDGLNWERFKSPDLQKIQSQIFAAIAQA